MTPFYAMGSFGSFPNYERPDVRLYSSYVHNVELENDWK